MFFGYLYRAIHGNIHESFRELKIASSCSFVSPCNIFSCQTLSIDKSMETRKKKMVRVK